MRKQMPAAARRFDRPLSRFPLRGKAGAGGFPPRRQNQAAPPTRGAAAPLVHPPAVYFHCGGPDHFPAASGRQAQPRPPGWWEERGPPRTAEMAGYHTPIGIDMQADWTKVLGWPGYRVYDYQIDEARRHLTLRVRRKRGNRKLTCSQCGRRVHDIRAVYERTVRDLPCFEFQSTVVVELYRIRCPDCGIKSERSEQLPSKAPYSKRFEDSVGAACEGAAARQVARRMRLAESTVRAIDLRYLERWEARRRKPPLRHMGVDEI